MTSSPQPCPNKSRKKSPRMPSGPGRIAVYTTSIGISGDGVTPIMGILSPSLGGNLARSLALMASVLEAKPSDTNRLVTYSILPKEANYSISLCICATDPVLRLLRFIRSRLGRFFRTRNDYDGLYYSQPPTTNSPAHQHKKKERAKLYN